MINTMWRQSRNQLSIVVAAASSAMGNCDPWIMRL